MTHLPPERQDLRKSGNELLKALQATQWLVPSLLALIGVGYTFFENQRHHNEPGWPWLTWLGLFVLGFLGPSLAWVCLRWALRVARAYLATHQKLSSRAEELTTLNKLSLAASHSLDLEETISTILEKTMTALNAAAGMVFIQDGERNGLQLKAYRGISTHMAEKEARLQPGHCLCGKAVTTRQVLFASDVGNDPRCTSDLCICEGFRSVACAPLEAKGQLVGLMQLASPRVAGFNVDQREFLATVASQVSVSIENARLYDTVQAFNVELEKKVNRRTRELEAARWALAEKARKLQRLLSESYRIQEDTQARIAQDMHDGVTQMIIGALYETQAARQSLGDNPDQAVESLSRAQQLLSEVEAEIRRVIYDLHPPVLDMMGLVVALKRFAITFQEIFDLDCEVTVTGRSRRLEKETEITIYRIIQAALQNITSHAQASQARVAFGFGADWFQVIVEDNGIGFDPQAAGNFPGEHLGLIGMKERAESLGASLAVDSTPGKGTTINLRLGAPVYLD